jgi:F-type H+-transporting ATPase subunit epsilon
MTLRLDILTPQAAVLSQPVEEVVAPIPDGWLGILPGHAPFVARLMPGEVIVRDGGKERLVATIGGILAVSGDLVTVLTGVARLDSNLETLEREISDEARQLAAIETEAEKHFDRVLRQASAAFAGHRRHDS